MASRFFTHSTPPKKTGDPWGSGPLPAVTTSWSTHTRAQARRGKHTAHAHARPPAMAAPPVLALTDAVLADFKPTRVFKARERRERGERARSEVCRAVLITPF